MVSPEFDIRPSILVGDSSDVYLQRTLTILRNEGINPTVAMEFYPETGGVLCGIKEVRALLAKVLHEAGTEVWFGANQVTSVTFVSSNELRVVAPSMTSLPITGAGPPKGRARRVVLADAPVDLSVANGAYRSVARGAYMYSD